MSNAKAIKFIRFLEKAWIVISITLACIGIYESFMRGIGQSYMFFIFAFIAAILHGLRKKQRINMEKESEDESS